MRLKISFKTTKIPKHYRMRVLSLIKKAFLVYSPDLYNELYKHEGKKNKKSKDFTFSLYMPEFKEDGDYFLTDEIVINISSANKKIMLHMYNAFLRLDECNLGSEYSLIKDDVKLYSSKEVKNDYCMLKTMSPIAIKNKAGRFLDMDNEEYMDSFNYMANQILINYRGEGLSRPLELMPVNMKKVVVQEKIKDFTLKTGKEIMYINSYEGIFVLKGDKRDLTDLSALGVGYRRNQGFGMVEVV